MPLYDLLGGTGPGGRGGPQLRASVLSHLRNMCRTRRGTMAARPDYGLPDVSEMVHSFPRAIEELRAALQQTIETYEPRLTNVRVKHLASASLELAVRFEVTATLLDESDAIPVRYETRVNASRAVLVE